MNARHPLRVVVVAAVALAGLTACASTPGAKRVALDVVDTLDVPEPQKACMREAIEAFDDDELQDIAEFAFENAGDSDPELTRFEAALRRCRTTS